MSIRLWEAVAEPTERFPSCHCSVIQELSNGDILVGYYAGEGEAQPTAAYVLARRRPGASDFEPLKIVADTPGKPEGNGILFQTQDGTVILIYGTMHGKLDGPPGPGVRWVTCDLRVKRSTDNGETWSEVEQIEPEVGHVPRCKPIRLDNGEIIFGTEYKDGYSRLWVSADDGDAWQMVGSIPGGKNQHPSLIQRRDGSLLALLRPSGRDANVLKSVSTDRGRTWTRSESTGLPCPYAALDAVQLTDGRIVMAWNNHPKTRNPLTLALSEDEGQTWKYVRDLVTGAGSFHYPAIIQTHDGLLHLTFTNNRRTIDHVVLTPEWIMGEGADLPAWTGEGMERRI
jgi:hypothetical protein